MYVQDRCTIIAKYSIYNFTNTTSLLWSGNRTKTLNYSEVAIRTICLSICLCAESCTLSADSQSKIDFGKDRS